MLGQGAGKMGIPQCESERTSVWGHRIDVHMCDVRSRAV